MNAGCGMGRVELRVRRANKLQVVSAFGVSSELPVVDGTRDP